MNYVKKIYTGKTIRSQYKYSKMLIVLGKNFRVLKPSLEALWVIIYVFNFFFNFMIMFCIFKIICFGNNE